MAERFQQTRDVMEDVFGGRDLGEAGVAQGMQMILPGRQGDTSINVQGGIITSQRVAVKRDDVAIKNKLKALAAMAGKAWVYGWSVKDKRNNRETWIEGATIKLANDLARTYGNCMVNIRVEELATGWMFYGRFVDLETGFSLERPYQQRKNMNTGMADNQRANDMIFQIGASKCIRNVVVNALQTYADFCVDEAKGSMLSEIEGNQEKARAWILKHLKTAGVDVKRVEKIYARKAENWTVPDMAKIISEVHSVEDGMALATDVWPLAEDSADEDETLKVQTKVNKQTPKPAAAEKPADTKETDQNKGREQTEAGAAAGSEAAGAQQAAGEPVSREEAKAQGRALVIDGGEPLGRTLQEFELGETVRHGGKDYRVIEFNDREVVVTPVKAAAAQKQTAQKSAAESKKGGGKMFGDD